MNACGAGQRRDVGAVVDDRASAPAGARVGDRGLREIEERAARPGLGAQLQQSRAAGEEARARRRRGARSARGADVDVDDGVEPRRA